MSELHYYFWLCLAVWRITSLLMNEAGPYNVLHRLRFWAGIRHNRENAPIATTELAKVFQCHWCLSLWVSLVFVVGLCFSPGWTFTAALPFALSAVSILIAEVFSWLGRVTAHS